MRMRNESLTFRFNDGGRSKYFRATQVGDCVVRAAAIAAQKDYKEVYNAIRGITGYSPRNGVLKKDTKKIMEFFGGVWIPTMKIGTGCKVHLNADELPKGRIVCNCSGHVVAVIDGVINDTYDSSRDGYRCVYGYWIFENKTNMSYLEQMKKWLSEHPKASAEDAWQAGYLQATHNWVNKTFGKKDDTKRQKNN